MYHIHGYHDDISKLEEKLVKANFASMGKTEGMKGKLSKKQKGLCPICNICSAAYFSTLTDR